MSSNGDWKPLSEYTPGDFAIVGGVLAVALSIVAFIVLALAGVIPGVPASDNPKPTPTVAASATPEPTPAPELLGGEDRRACGYLFTTFEWVVKQRDRRWEDKYWFTNDREVAEGVVTLLDGCYLDEEGMSLVRSDSHEPFDVMQFRLSEFGDGKHDLKLFHDGVRVYP